MRGNVQEGNVPHLMRDAGINLQLFHVPQIKASKLVTSALCITDRVKL